MSQHRAAGHRVTPGNAARKTGAARRSAKHRVARRSTPGTTQLFGLTAALAAAAGAVGFSHSSLASPTPANSAVNLAAQSLDESKLSGITTARIQARTLATRDHSRVQLTSSDRTKKQAAAKSLAGKRALKLAANQKLTMQRANSLLKAKLVEEEKERKERESANRCEMVISNYRISATFGQGGGRWARNHTGTDFAAPIGTPIRAVKKGEVIAAEFAGPYGKQVRIRHEDGTETSYSHMSRFTVSPGETVYAGDKVGAVGVTGNTTGPHLHFEVRPGGGEPINPLSWLRNKCGLNV